MILIVNSEGKVRCFPSGEPMVFDTEEDAKRSIQSQGLTDAYPIDLNKESHTEEEELTYGHDDALW